MRKITQEVTRAFLNGEKKTLRNTSTDGNGLYLWGNKIAERRGGSLFITNAGWNTQTTNERLNGLPGVNVYHVRGKLHLNGEKWDGDWINPVTREQRGEEEIATPFKSLKMVASLGNVFCDTQEEQNAWKVRMLKAGLGEGLSLPEDWEELSEEEKAKRLNGAVESL